LLNSSNSVPTPLGSLYAIATPAQFAIFRLPQLNRKLLPFRALHFLAGFGHKLLRLLYGRCDSLVAPDVMKSLIVTKFTFQHEREVTQWSN